MAICDIRSGGSWAFDLPGGRAFVARKDVMSLNAWLVPLAFIALLLVLVRPLGSYMARVFGGEITWLASLERGIYRLGGVDSDKEMDWKNYALAVLIFNFLGFVLLYLLQRGQVFLPLNPADLPAVR